MSDTSVKDTVLEISGLNKIYRDFWRRPTVNAVNNLNLSVTKGEIFGLLGPNGSGKSTTIKLILGLLKPSSGSISVFGASPTDVTVKNKIGYLPEITCLHKFLTPHETLSYYAGLFAMDKETAKDRIDELLEMVDLKHAAHRQVGQFSKGMARRVGLAQALINNPDFIILDEPTSGLDPIACRAMKDWIKMLAESGKTILMTSHLLADVEDICDRVAIISNGNLCAEGKISEILQRSNTFKFLINNISDEEAKVLLAKLEAEAQTGVRVEKDSLSLEDYFINVIAKARNEDIISSPPANFLTTKANSEK